MFVFDTYIHNVCLFYTDIDTDTDIVHLFYNGNDDVCLFYTGIDIASLFDTGSDTDIVRLFPLKFFFH